MSVSSSTFTGADSTPVTSIDGFYKANLDGGNFRLASNKAYFTDGTYDVIVLPGVATVDGEYTEAVFDFKSLVGQVGIAVRLNSSGNTGYLLVYRASDTKWRLLRMVSAGFTEVANAVASPSLATHTLRLRATGTGASVAVVATLDGGALLSYSDTDTSRITTLGRCGIYGDTIVTTTTGIHVDSLVLEDGSAAGPVLSSPTASATGASGQVQIGVSIDSLAGVTALKSLQRLAASPAADAATILASGVTRALGGSAGAQGPYTVTGLTDGTAYAWDWAASNGTNSNVQSAGATPYTAGGGVKAPAALLARLLTPRS